eukprot:scaffold42568_cov29-Prasinocladus_malaysianus.AAC.1
MPAHPSRPFACARLIQGWGTLEDEGAISSQTDESITSFCLEAMNQGDEPPEPSASENDAQIDHDIDMINDDEFSNIIHMATETALEGAPESGLPEGWDPDEMQELEDLVPHMSIDCKGDGPSDDWRF